MENQGVVKLVQSFWMTAILQKTVKIESCPDMILYSTMMETRGSSNVHYVDGSFVLQALIYYHFSYGRPNKFSI